MKDLIEGWSPGFKIWHILLLILFVGGVVTFNPLLTVSVILCFIYNLGLYRHKRKCQIIFISCGLVILVSLTFHGLIENIIHTKPAKLYFYGKLVYEYLPENK